MKNFFVSVLFIVIATMSVAAQVRGIVVDASGEPLVGVSVQADGSPVGTISGVDGRFVVG